MCVCLRYLVSHFLWQHQVVCRTRVSTCVRFLFWTCRCIVIVRKPRIECQINRWLPSHNQLRKRQKVINGVWSIIDSPSAASGSKSKTFIWSNPIFEAHSCFRSNPGSSCGMHLTSESHKTSVNILWAEGGTKTKEEQKSTPADRKMRIAGGRCYLFGGCGECFEVEKRSGSQFSIIISCAFFSPSERPGARISNCHPGCYRAVLPLLLATGAAKFVGSSGQWFLKYSC